MNGERLTAGDICTRVVAIAFGSTAVTEAARVMREQHVGSLVVVDETSMVDTILIATLFSAAVGSSVPVTPENGSSVLLFRNN